MISENRSFSIWCDFPKCDNEDETHTALSFHNAESQFAEKGWQITDNGTYCKKHRKLEADG